MAKSQAAYDRSVKDLFHHLDKVESHVKNSRAHGPFYCGSSITEADIRLYVTMIRFDSVYFNLFKTNKTMIRLGYPAIHAWMQNLYWNIPAFRETTNFKHIRSHYFKSLTMINPFGIIPSGPDVDILPIQETTVVQDDRMTDSTEP
jgi:glutathionyl-hydroquinone reductase